MKTLNVDPLKTTLARYMTRRRVYRGRYSHVYESIPDNEIWIDNDIHQDERGFVLFHEMHERNLMAKGRNYDDAHEESSRLERYYRDHPAKLHEALIEEGWE